MAGTPPKYILTHGTWVLGSHGLWERRPLCGPPMLFHSMTAVRKHRKRNPHHQHATARKLNEVYLRN